MGSLETLVLRRLMDDVVWCYNCQNMSGGTGRGHENETVDFYPVVWELGPIRLLLLLFTCCFNLGFCDVRVIWVNPFNPKRNEVTQVAWIWCKRAESIF